MALRPFTARKVEDKDLDLIQEDLERTINPALKKAILDGFLTDSVALTTSFQNIAHKLGKKFTGWIVVSPDADARIWQDSTNPDSALFIRVRASAAVNCRFWVF